MGGKEEGRETGDGNGDREKRGRKAMPTGFLLNFHPDNLILMFIWKWNLAKIARKKSNNKKKNRGMPAWLSWRSM